MTAGKRNTENQMDGRNPACSGRRSVEEEQWMEGSGRRSIEEGQWMDRGEWRLVI
jgi:hypothetical protein